MKDIIRQMVAEALENAAADGALPGEVVGQEFEVTEPPRPELGDLSTNVALALARVAKRPPMEIARAIVERLAEHEYVDQVEVAPPGFINFRLKPAWLHDVVRQILQKREQYGRSDWGAGKRVQVEFVSANPVGPLHIGNARGGPYGDVVASLLEATGHYVEREYYINDGPENTQLKLFGASLQARYLQLIGEEAEVPEDGYHADYVTELARELVEKHGDSLRDVPRSDEGALKFFWLVRDRMVQWLKEECEALGIEFDVWFSEQSLYDEGKVQEAIERLKQAGAAYEKDGAIWLASSRFGDDEDRVLVRSTGAPTYLASDVAYAINKFLERGFDTAIYVWGPDHAGYVARVKAAIAALGIDPQRAEIIIYQTVRFLEGGQPARFSKRAGRIVSVRELVDQIGRDATRFFFLLRSVDAHLDFDLDLARRESEENPVYYVQYAHARIRSIEREAVGRQMAPGDGSGVDVAWLEGAPLELLVEKPELDLMRMLAEYPELISKAARDRAPHRLTHFAVDLARIFHQFYDRCRVLDAANRELTRARLALVWAAGQVLRNLLGILKVSAPDRM